jgi:hypothetical protein
MKVRNVLFLIIFVLLAGLSEKKNVLAQTTWAIFPQFFDGNGFQTEITVINGNEDNLIQIGFRGCSDSPEIWLATNKGLFGTKRFELKPKEILKIKTAGTSLRLLEGFVSVIGNKGFQQANLKIIYSGGEISIPGIYPFPPGKKFLTIPIEYKRGLINNKVVIKRTNFSLEKSCNTLELNLRLFDKNGQLRETKTIKMGGYFSNFISEIFAEFFKDIENFSGYLEINVSENNPPELKINALSLKFEGDSKCYNISLVLPK